MFVSTVKLSEVLSGIERDYCKDCRDCLLSSTGAKSAPQDLEMFYHAARNQILGIELLLGGIDKHPHITALKVRLQTRSQRTNYIYLPAEG